MDKEAKKPEPIKWEVPTKPLELKVEITGMNAEVAPPFKKVSRKP